MLFVWSIYTCDDMKQIFLEYDFQTTYVFYKFSHRKVYLHKKVKRIL